MRKPLIRGKWASRKLWTLIFSLLFVILNDVVGFGLNEETYWAIVSVASSYLIGQGLADMKQSK